MRIKSNDEPIKDLMRAIGDMTPITRMVAGIMERAVIQHAAYLVEIPARAVPQTQRG